MLSAAPMRSRLLDTGEQPLLLDLDGRRRGGRELIERVDRLAGALQREGLAGQRVGVWFQNSIAAVEAYLAIEWVGATRVVVDPGAAAAEAQTIFAAAGARGVLADRAHAEQLSGLVLVHEDEQPLADRALQPLEQVPAERPLHLYPRAVQGGELFAIPISYGNWAAIIELNCALYRSGRYGGPWEERSEVILTTQQLLHGTGLLGSFPFLSMGAAQVLMREFEPQRAPEICERFAVTSTGMTSGMLSRLIDVIGDARTPSLRRLIYGGGHLPPAQLRRAVETLGPVLVQIYGRLEGGWPLSILDQRDHAEILAGDERRASSCGRPVGGPVELELRPVRDRDAGIGEISTRSPMVVADYADPDGWCALGDLAHLDDDGYLHLDGRLDDMVNTGYHVYPAEIEEALLALPGVQAARVVGEPDIKRGQILAAYVVGQLDADALSDRLRQRLAAYKVPRRFHLVNELPATRALDKSTEGVT